MIPFEFLDSAKIPGNSEELRLYRRGNEYSIRLSNYELMNSRMHGSEDALGERACKKIAGRPCARVLIGGMGMGYTTAAALKLLGADAHVVVAELVSAVVEWNRGALADLAGHPLDDKRVTVQETDVAKVLRAERNAFDAILLDVDNGPEGLTRQRNDWLYTQDGLNAAFAALRPGGILAIWSAGPDRLFIRRLRKVGFKVEEITARAHRSRGSRHIIWLAERNL